MSTSDKRILDKFQCIRQTLALFSHQVVQKGHGCWAFSFTEAGPETGSARIQNRWLLLQMHLGDEGFAWKHPDHVEQVLQWNASLHGNTKFVFHRDTQTMCVQAELPLETGMEEGRRISRALEGFGQAWQRYHGKSTGKGTHGPSGPLPQENDPAKADLPSLCKEADWSFSEHEDGRVVVELDVPGSFFQAVVAHENDRRIRAGVDLLGEAPRSSMMYEAACLLLLNVCRASKMVRATVRHLDGQTAALGLETVLEAKVSTGEIGRAFSALSVACGLCGNEIRAMKDERIAELYLARARGRSPKPCRKNTGSAHFRQGGK